jgi:putative endonuclease
MVDERTYYVYIVGNPSATIYVGVTNDLGRRVAEHKSGEIKGFTSRYGVRRLFYFEESDDISVALEREKQIKGWRRSKKLALIRSTNPRFRDLAEEWDA